MAKTGIYSDAWVRETVEAMMVDLQREADQAAHAGLAVEADELTGEAEHLAHEEGAAYGDPRRCPRHGEIISSADGMFDGVCGACEHAAEGDEDELAADAHASVAALVTSDAIARDANGWYFTASTTTGGAK